MITKLSHATVYVLDQEKAKQVYTEALGFEVRTDATMDGFRWLTVGLRSQPDVEIVLYDVSAPMLDADVSAHLRAVLEKGMMGPGVMQTTNIREAYEQLQSRGIEFVQPPQERPYGIEAIFRDACGNWYSLTQPGQ